MWIDFLNKFKQYDVYIMCDRNSHDYSELWNTSYPNVKFLQIVRQEPESAGFANLSSAISPQQVVNSWDKAVYYFSKINTTYDNVWLIEEDVYFYSEQTLLDIDSKFPQSDLLTNAVTERAADMNSAWNWHWCLFSVGVPEPHRRAMVCATRFSKAMFASIADYAAKNRTLFYLEACFPTLALHYKLKHDCPMELSTVEYRHDWSSEHINNVNLYHPLKNLDEHVDNRLFDRFAF